MNLKDAPLRDLCANAEVLAETLENDRRPQSAALIRELVARVVPLKAVRSGGTHPKTFVREPMEAIAPVKLGIWCDQCDRMKTEREVRACQSRFCKVAA